MKNIHIIDGNNFLARAYHAVPELKTSKGVYVNAIKGFSSMLELIKWKYKPTHLAVVFDGPNSKQSRLKIDKNYKSNRNQDKEKYEEKKLKFYPQIPLARRILDAANIASFNIEGHEADDVIGTLVYTFRKEGNIHIHSSDKDFAQLLRRDNIFLHKPANRFQGEIIITSKNCKDIYGYTPKQAVEYLAMVGDRVDNIVGLKGIGHKTAVKLLGTYLDIAGIEKNTDNLTKSISKTFESEENISRLKLNKKLARIKLRLSELEGITIQDIKTKPANVKKLQKIKKELEFSDLLGK